MRSIIRFLRRLIYELIWHLPINSELRCTILRIYGVQIGERCKILAGIGAFGSEPYLIKIGNHCEITSGVRFITHDGATWVFRERPTWNDGINRYGKIELKDNVFVGINSIVLPNVSIGPNSIVAAGSVVTSDVPPGVIVAGNPAKVIGDLEPYFKKINNQSLPGIGYASKSNKDALKANFWKEDLE